MGSIVEGVIFVSERELGPWICCAPCSAAMAVGAALGQSVNLSGTAHGIRTAASTSETHRPPDGSPGGMNQSQIVAGVANAYGLAMIRCSYSKTALMDGLADGMGYVVQLTYGKLPERLRRWSPSFTGGHSVYVAGTRSGGRIGWFDPLATAGWSGEWVTLEEVWPALWSSGFDGLQRKGTKVVGLAVDITEQYTGKATVAIDGAYAVQLADREYIKTAKNVTKDAFALGVLADDLSETWPKGTPVVLIGDQVAIWIREQVTLTQTDSNYVAVEQLYIKRSSDD